MSLRSTIAPLLLLALAVAGCDRQDSAPKQASAPAPVAAAPGGAAPAEGEKVAVDTIGTLDRTHKGEAPPATSFNMPEGTPTTIAALIPALGGKPVLVNLWATWCAPCVKEMPMLDQVAARMTVVSISQDLDAAKVAPFFAKEGLKNLKPYHDPLVQLSVDYQASLPLSILYDSTGHEVWRMTGGMDWTTPSATELLAEAK